MTTYEILQRDHKALQEENETLKARIAQLEKSHDHAYPTLESYEELVGYKTNEAFRVGWKMSRITKTQLGIEE